MNLASPPRKGRQKRRHSAAPPSASRSLQPARAGARAWGARRAGAAPAAAGRRDGLGAKQSTA